MKSNKRLIGAGIVSAIGASLCCITPVLAFISGTSGVASSFGWMEPYRPLLITVTIEVLGFAWYQKLKKRSVEEIACDCEDDGKPPFIQSKLFLGLVTVFAITMLSFPYFSKVFYPDVKPRVVIVVSSENILTDTISISGMTCEGCEVNIHHSINELEGILSMAVSHKSKNAVIQYDKTKTNNRAIRNKIIQSGYTPTRDTL